jgi:hypothetical protein
MDQGIEVGFDPAPSEGLGNGFGILTEDSGIEHGSPDGTDGDAIGLSAMTRLAGHDGPTAR